MIGQCVVLLLAVALVRSDEVCKPEELEECFQSSVAAEWLSLTALPREDFLNENCGPTIESIECFMERAPKCADLVLNNTRWQILDSILDLMRSICDEDSDLRKGYLENVDCYDTIEDQVNHCETEVSKTVREFGRTRPQTPRIDPVCIALPATIGCVIEEVEDSCGADGAAAMVEILSLFSSGVKEAICPDDLVLALEAEYLIFLEERRLEMKKKRK